MAGKVRQGTFGLEPVPLPDDWDPRRDSVDEQGNRWDRVTYAYKTDAHVPGLPAGSQYAVNHSAQTQWSSWPRYPGEQAPPGTQVHPYEQQPPAAPSRRSWASPFSGHLKHVLRAFGG